jgi:hypothetical protein
VLRCQFFPGQITLCDMCHIHSQLIKRIQASGKIWIEIRATLMLQLRWYQYVSSPNLVRMFTPPSTLNQLGLGPALDPSFHLGSPNHELSFKLFLLGSESIDFPSKMVWHLPSISDSLILDPSKGHWSNLWLSANSIALFHWTLDLRCSS